MKDESYWSMLAEIRELKEINKMLQKNMFHYEYRARDALIEVLKLEAIIQTLKAQIESLTAPSET